MKKSLIEGEYIIKNYSAENVMWYVASQFLAYDSNFISYVLGMAGYNNIITDVCEMLSFSAGLLNALVYIYFIRRKGSEVQKHELSQEISKFDKSLSCISQIEFQKHALSNNSSFDYFKL
jgi:hypothetical protein